MSIHLASWQKLLGVFSALLVVGGSLVVAMIFSPVAGSSPVSLLVAPTATLDLSPEAICGPWFSIRLDTRVPLEKRAPEQAEYERCLEAARAHATNPAATPDFSNRPRPQATFSGGATAVVPRTPAGAGTILQESASPLNPFYIIENQWVLEEQDKVYVAYAGALRVEGNPEPVDSMQGIVVVWVWKPRGGPLPGGGQYPVPEKKGPVRVVGAQGQRLVLQTRDGTTFYFDLPSRRYVSSLSEVVPTITPLPTPTTRTYPRP